VRIEHDDKVHKVLLEQINFITRQVDKKKGDEKGIYFQASVINESKKK